MRLDPKEMIAGQSALRVRKLLRRTSGGEVYAEMVSRELGLSCADATHFIHKLQRLGLVKTVMTTDITGKERRHWENTVKGNALAMASAARPIVRRSADRLLDGFLDRVAAVNSSANLAYQVRRVTVFGSYLSDKPQINDIDLLVDLEPKETDRTKQEALEIARRRDAAQRGRVLRTFIDDIGWPYDEVRLLLKNRSRSLSLHYTDRALVERVPHKVIYEQRRQEPNNAAGVTARKLAEPHR